MLTLGLAIGISWAVCNWIHVRGERPRTWMLALNLGTTTAGTALMALADPWMFTVEGYNPMSATTEVAIAGVAMGGLAYALRKIKHGD